MSNRRVRGWERPVVYGRQLPPPNLLPLGPRRNGPARIGRVAPRRRPPKAALRFAQQLEEQRVFSLGGDKPLWRTLAKLLLAVAPLLVAVQWSLSSTANTYSRALAESLATHHVLQENRAALDTLRGRLSSPERIRIIAAEKLSLYSPNKEQIEIY